MAITKDDYNKKYPNFVGTIGSNDYKNDPSVSNVREKTGLKWIDENLTYIDENSYNKAKQLADYQKQYKEQKINFDFIKMPENFNDGYQFGDITKAIGSTALDLGTTGVKSMMGIGESLGDLGQYGVAQVADWLGADSFANKLRENAKYNAVDSIFKPAEETYTKNSIAGKTTRDLASGVGYVAGLAYGGEILPKKLQNINVGKFSMPTTSIFSGMGNSIGEAYENGATDAQAWTYGTMSGLAEGFSESLFGGLGKKLGKGALDDVIVGNLTKNIKTPLVKVLTQSGLKATGEGLEEIVSALGSAFAKKMTYMSKEDLSKIIKDEKLLEQALMGTLTSMIVQAPSTHQSIKNKTDYITGKQLYPNTTQNLSQNSIIQDKNGIRNTNILPIENNSKTALKNQINDIQNKDNRALYKYQSNNINSYSEIEIKNFSNGKVKIAESENDIANFVEVSTKVPSNAKLYFGKIGTNIANKIKNALGLNVENYNISLQTNAIRHILKNHGDNNIESQRGQIAVTKEDFKLIPKIVSEYDSIQNTGVTENGNPAITFQKQIEDNYYLVSYTSDKNHNLEVKTMYKFKANEKNSTSASDVITPRSQTSETDKGTSSFTDNNITQSNDNVKLSNNYSMQEIQNNSNLIDKTRINNLNDNNILPVIKKNSRSNTQINPIPIKELNAKKYENNKNAIGRLEQEKYKAIKNIEDKIKSKTEEYNSKNNKDTIVANKLNQQIAVLNNQKQNIEAEYNNRINTLQTRNEKMTTKEFKTNEQKMTKKQEYDQLALELIKNIRTWNDKNKGLKYKINTMENNFYDIIPDKVEADRLIDNCIKPITEHNALKEKFINYYNEKIQSLNLSDKESIAVQMLGESKYIEGINDKAMSASEMIKTAEDYIRENNLDRNKIQNSVVKFREVLDELLVKANHTLRTQGFKEIDYRKDYFMHFEDPIPNSKIGKLATKLGWNFVNDEIPTSIAGITDTFKPNKIWTSFSQRRYGNSTTYNALKGFDKYVRGVADLIYHTEDIQKLRSLENMIRYQYSDKSIQDEYNNINNMDLDNDSKEKLIEELFDKVDNPLGNLVTELRSYTDNLANKKSELDRRIEHNVGRKFYNTATNIQNRLSANMVGLNISSALTNFIPITQAWSQVSTKNLLRGIKQSISNSFREDGLVDNSVFLTNRTKQADRLYKTNLEKISDKFNIVFDAVDSFTANTVVRAKYLDNLEKGMNSKQAMQDADQFAKNLIAGRDKGSMPTIFNSKNPIVKLFTSFQLEVANQYNYMFKDMPRNLKSQGMVKLTSAFLKMFLGAWLYNKFSESITGRKSAFSPIDILSETVDEFKKDTSLYNKLSSTSKNIASELPFIGGLLGGGRLPISSALPNVGTTIESIINLSDDEKRKTAINNLTSELKKPIFYVVMPFGGGQLKKTVEGLSMYTKDLPGSYTNSGNLRFTADTDPLSVLQSAIFGQYSGKNAREYFDKGYSPLGEKQQAELKELNIPISDYWKYRKELSKKDSVEKKIDYIANSNFSNEQKNIMVNNAVNRKEEIDLTDYDKYDSYAEFDFSIKNPEKYQFLKDKNVSFEKYTENKEEYDYAYTNPEKYAVINQITSYKNYSQYKDKIEEVRESSSDKKVATIKTINNLNLNIPQKAMLIKLYYPSYNNYNEEIIKYINQQQGLSANDKSVILTKLGFTVENGRVVY